MNDLSCGDCLCLALNKLVAFGEATFSKELAFDVLTERHFTILMLDFFFNDLCSLCSISSLLM